MSTIINGCSSLDICCLGDRKGFQHVSSAPTTLKSLLLWTGVTCSDWKSRRVKEKPKEMEVTCHSTHVQHKHDTVDNNNKKAVLSQR